MSDLAAQTLLDDPRIAQAKTLIAQALADAQGRIDGTRPADPQRAQAFNEQLERFGQLRGGKLWYPYIGSGIGRGALVELTDGSVKYDMINGIGVHGLGHSDPGMIAAAIDGALGDTMMQGNLQANLDSMQLCDEILKLAKAGGSKLEHCFLTTSGAMANENALKIIFQKHAPADRIIAFSHCFSGRTMALASVTDKAAYRDGIPDALRVSYLPYFKSDDPDKSIDSALTHLRSHLARYKGRVAGVMFELVQGEGGYHAGDPRFFKALMAECKEQGVAVFADEIQTFGRTTQPFAFQHYGLGEYIDVVAMGKMSQVCATLFSDEYKPRPGLISQTFTGATPQIHTALEIIDRMQREAWFGADGRIEKVRAGFEKRLAQLHQKHPTLIGGELFGVGSMLAFQVFGGAADKTTAFLNRLFANGVIAFVCGSVSSGSRVRFLPPVSVITDEDIDAVCAIVDQTLIEVDEELTAKQEA